jgi:hypothetical protein
MLEIIFLIWFGRKLATMAKEKGRSGAWAMLGVGMWIGGEIFGFVLGMLLEMDAGMYIAGLGCAVLGAVVSYGIVSSLSATEFAPDADGFGV